MQLYCLDVYPGLHSTNTQAPQPWTTLGPGDAGDAGDAVQGVVLQIHHTLPTQRFGKEVQ